MSKIRRRSKRSAIVPPHNPNRSTGRNRNANVAPTATPLPVRVKTSHASAIVSTHSEANARALPIVEDGIVPIDRFNEFLTSVYQLFDRYQIKTAMWGHGGDANVHIQPLLDLGLVGDRQKMFRLIDEYHDLVISLGGSITAEHGDGRLRAPYLAKMYGPDIYSLFQQVKQIFDPHNTLNPGVKINVSLDDIKPLVRTEYSVIHAHHLPRN